MNWKYNLVILNLILLLFTQIGNAQDTKTTISAEELNLYNQIMDYRRSKGLKKIPLSNSLTIVAQTHCKDLYENNPDSNKGCNAHSWSENEKWTGCCYSPDHKQANCMWDKPKELTSYQGYGFEIACGSSKDGLKDFNMTADYAIKSWKGSTHHNKVLINAGIWKDFEWNAIGIGIHKGFATVWFGKKLDAAGEPSKSK